MRHRMLFVVAISAIVGAAAVAQDAEYALRDYMPGTVGSTWSLLPTGETGRAMTMEVLPPQDVGGQQISPLVTKGADGAIRNGTFQTVDATGLTIYGTLFNRGQQGGQAAGGPTTIAYDPPAKFPGALKVGQSASATFKSAMRGQPADVTMTVTLAAVESVTVPKGTFADCLKIVTTTTFGQGQMTRTAWYAKGVGTVKMERQGRNGQINISELVDYKLAE